MSHSLSGTSLGKLGEEPQCGPGETPVPEILQGIVGSTCTGNTFNVFCGEGEVYDDKASKCVPDPRLSVPSTIEKCGTGQWLNPYGKCEGKVTKPATSGGGGYVAPKPTDTPPSPVEAGMSTTSKVAIGLLAAAVGLVGYKVAKKRGMI